MPRPLVFGNGRLLVTTDSAGAVRDLHWPHYAHVNHVNAHRIRLGAWADGKFVWLDEAGPRQSYRPGTMVGVSEWMLDSLGILITLTETVAADRPAWIRHLSVVNRRPFRQEIRLFQTHDLRINESDVGDCAFYCPHCDAVIHFKDEVAFAFSGRTETEGLHQYATGIKAFEGMEGTWKDAEDGMLEGDPISQGSVDSTISLSLSLDSGASGEAMFWMRAGHSVPELLAGWEEVSVDQGEVWFSKRAIHDTEFVSGLGGQLSMNSPYRALAIQSLLIMESNRSASGGIVAANDTDIMETNRATYSYIWARDGALTSEVYRDAGCPAAVDGYIDWAVRTFGQIAPVFFQKYRAGGRFGASWHPWIVDGKAEFPFQQDETALTVRLASESRQNDEEVWESLVRPAADFMLEFRQPNGLPKPSWDLWEERRGIHFWTVGSVIEALRGAAKMARVCSDPERAERYDHASVEMASAAREAFLPDGADHPGRTVTVDAFGKSHLDSTPDASVLAACLRTEAFADWIEPTVRMVRNHLVVNSTIGGVARYVGDYYFRQTDEYPGNPWVICTMWLAQAELRLGKPGDRQEAAHWLDWVLARQASTGVLAEQYHPQTGEPLSVSPLTWSHAEVVATVLAFERTTT